MGMPRWRPTAIRIISSSICNPRKDIGSAFNHAPVSLAETAKSLVRQLLFQEDDYIMWLVPEVCPMLSTLCLMVEQEKLSAD